MTRGDNIDKAFDALSEAVDRAWSAVRPLCEQHKSPETPAPGGENLFVHLDGDGDGVYVHGHSCKAGWLTLSLTESPHVHLGPDTVNRLAQYLDMHRTDGHGTGQALRCACGRRRDR